MPGYRVFIDPHQADRHPARPDIKDSFGRVMRKDNLKKDPFEEPWYAQYFGGEHIFQITCNIA
jgi:hypothetical protein